ncbi:hypothetical protein AX16_002942 [Volvariella volvacea WC 439]|nr:hypothetical protein AX16_002942 [Volvariella volvacea WC 439]
MGPTVASVLGIKGNIRFRPHGSLQKPHVVLRRVSIREGINERGEGIQVVSFSLFASKRIEVKPGKEILLSIDGVDSHLKDQPVVFEADLPSMNDISDEEGDTQVAEEEEDVLPPPTDEAIPPKMRRAWAKKVVEASPVVAVQPVIHQSIGVQAQPVCVSASIDATPECTTSGVQTYIENVSQAIQVDPPAPPPSISISIQTNDPPIYVSSDVQTDSYVVVEANAKPAVAHDKFAAASEHKWVSVAGPQLAQLTQLYKGGEHTRDRSLSPMELDSPNFSPRGSTSPPPCLGHSRVPPKSSTAPHRPSPVSSIASSSGAQDEDIPKRQDSRASNSLRINTSIPSSSSSQTIVESQPTITPSSSTPKHIVATVTADAHPSRHAPEQHQTTSKSLLPSTPIAPKTLSRQSSGRAELTNPFVSAGFVTEFVGGQTNTVKAVEGLKGIPQTANQPQTTSSVPHDPPSPVSSIASSDQNEPQQPQPVRHTLKPQPSAPRVMASVMKSESPAIPLGPKALNWGTGPWLHDKPPATSPLALRQAMASSSLGKKIPTQPSALRTSPPPDPKTLAYIPSGPSTNPLNIRPSNAALQRAPVRAPPTAPKVLTANATKKRVLVGSTWQPTRVAGPSTAATLTPTPPPTVNTPTAPAQPLKPAENPTPVQNNNKSSDLSRIVGYTSPSPPPTKPSQPTQPAQAQGASASKWKRVSGDVSSALPAWGWNKTEAWSESADTSWNAGGAPAAGEEAWTGDVRDSKRPVLHSNSPGLDYTESPNRSPPRASRSHKASSRSPSPKAQRRSWSPHSDHTRKTPTPSADTQRDRSSSTFTASSSLSATPIAAQASNTPNRQPASTSTPLTRSTTSKSDSTNQTSQQERDASQATNQASSTTPTSSKRPASPRPRMPSIASTLPQPLNHPLPPKPMLAQGTQGSRGLKRERPASPEYEYSRRRRRAFKWPTVDPHHTVALKGEGDLAVKSVVFSSDGTFFSITCADKTIRIWNSQNRAEIARLSHNAQVVAVSWMENDTGVVSLGEDGIVSKWTRTGGNSWQWAKVIDACQERKGGEEPRCLAYMRDRIAVAFPTTGVKIWMWLKGTWQPQRSILRQNVTVIRFIEEGGALLGGTRDGVLWQCEIPNGTLRALAMLKHKITSVDVNPTETHALVSHMGGAARAVKIRGVNNSSEDLVYTCPETDSNPGNISFGAVFATKGQAVLFGCVDGCVLVWDRKKTAIVYGLEHEDDDIISATASFDGSQKVDGCLVTGTKSGYLSWWAQPVAAPQSDEKRQKTS